jgi:DNA invertase Pin-like site-specific DNA recombinase
MYEDKGHDGKRKYTVAEIAETFGVSRKTVYRHLEPSGGRRQPGKTTPLLRDARHKHLPSPVANTAATPRLAGYRHGG